MKILITQKGENLTDCATSIASRNILRHVISNLIDFFQTPKSLILKSLFWVFNPEHNIILNFRS
jgi:hypothetical protein